MGSVLKQRLKQARFESPHQEGILSLMVAASYLRAESDRLHAEFGISTEQFNILRILRGVYPEGHACGEIGTRMVDRSPDITRRIDGLVKQGLVDRIRSTDDRRVVITYITQKGLDLLNQIQPKLQQMEQVSRKKLSVDEWKQLASLCERLFEDEFTTLNNSIDTQS